MLPAVEQGRHPHGALFIDNTEFAPEMSEAECERLLQNREHLLGEMIGYAMSDHCLRRRILSYFGQDLSGVAEKCDDCSACSEEGPERYLRETRGRTFGRASERLEERRDEASAYVTSDADEELFQRLRALRKRLADDAGLPPYVVFNDATLRAMVRRKPQTPQELLQVSGVGEFKLERYGEEFLAELAQ